MKHLPSIAGGLLGALFILSSAMFLLHLAPMPPPPKGTAVEAFMMAFVPTGYLTFVKVFELIGGFLVAVPRARNFGLLVLGPIIINIIAYSVFVMKDGYFSPPIIIIALLAAYLLWCGRRAFAGLAG